ncbi:MAG: cation:proton antiporter [Clostridiales bacterium]|jgi:Kef-type K+ transport system membrane component KefB|nr:cation:proton antiporter [Clostridiales bacterium]
MEKSYLLYIAIILFAAKVFGLCMRKIRMPQVLGMLIAGVLLGASGLGVIQNGPILSAIAELGVVVLMFTAGMETNITILKKTWKQAIVIALFGVALPMIAGFAIGEVYNLGAIHSIFLGVVLTATSISITVETLREMGKLNTPTGTVILGAAVIDDVLGIMILSVALGFAETGEISLGGMASIIAKFIIFVAIALVLGHVVRKYFVATNQKLGKVRRLTIFALAFCLGLSYLAERFGLADITGAYLAGVILANSMSREYIDERISTLSHVFFTPIFFAGIGLQTQLSGFNMGVVMFSLVFIIAAIVTKIIGCGIAGVMCKFKTSEALQIGIGMIPRGEVALIVASKGLALGYMDDKMFASTIIMVLVTILVTPIFLKMSYSKKNTD